MSTRLAPAPLDVSLTPRRIARLRAMVALGWAATIAIAAGVDAGPDLSVGLAVVVTAYPVIDVVASLTEADLGGDRSRLLRVNAAISTLAVAALAGAAFGSDVSAVLAVFGTWALVSGAIQLAKRRPPPARGHPGDPDDRQWRSLGDRRRLLHRLLRRRRPERDASRRLRGVRCPALPAVGLPHPPVRLTSVLSVSSRSTTGCRSGRCCRRGRRVRPTDLGVEPFLRRRARSGGDRRAQRRGRAAHVREHE
jgi:hypothetical protein